MQASIRKKRNFISKIKDDYGNWIIDMNLVSDFFVQDFRKRFTPNDSPSNQRLSSFLEVIDKCISSDTNEKLTANVTRDEVFDAISVMGLMASMLPSFKIIGTLLVTLSLPLSMIFSIIAPLCLVLIILILF